ncbi:MAG: hypothetical protein ACRDBM_13935 [Sporomusa sp.]
MTANLVILDKYLILANIHGELSEQALHIGTCKQIGWQLQEAVAAAVTPEELEAVTWPK